MYPRWIFLSFSTSSCAFLDVSIFKRNLIVSTYSGIRRQLRFITTHQQPTTTRSSFATTALVEAIRKEGMGDDDTNNLQRIFWDGPLFSRLTKSGKDYLMKRGWSRVDPKAENDQEDASSSSSSTTRRLAIVWPSKSGPQFEMNDLRAPYIRPYPKYMTDLVDDKIHLSELLKDTTIIPQRIYAPDNDDLASSRQSKEDDDKLYYVKYRTGAQGKSVYVYNRRELQEWYMKAQKNKNAKNFIIQDEIKSTLYNGRKYVLRSHILVLQRFHRNDDDDHPIVTFESYLYKDVICQHHAAGYHHDSKSNTTNKASHISQAGKKHPKPQLLQDLPSDHPAVNVFPQIVECSKIVVQHMSDHLLQRHNQQTGDNNVDSTTRSAAASSSPTSSCCCCFALLGTDLLLDESGQIKLCEINSHPALGWGTMKHVSSKVFTNLIQSTLSILIGGDNVDVDNINGNEEEKEQGEYARNNLFLELYSIPGTHHTD